MRVVLELLGLEKGRGIQRPFIILLLVSELGLKKDPHRIRNVTDKEHQVLLGLKFSLPLNSKYSLQRDTFFVSLLFYIFARKLFGFY